MFTQDQIDKCIQLFHNSDNIYDATKQPYTKDLLDRIINTMCLIERWSLITTHLIVHDAYREYFRAELKDRIDWAAPALRIDDPLYPHAFLRGMQVFFTDNIPINMMMALDLDDVDGGIDNIAHCDYPPNPTNRIAIGFFNQEP